MGIDNKRLAMGIDNIWSLAQGLDVNLHFTLHSGSWGDFAARLS